MTDTSGLRPRVKGQGKIGRTRLYDGATKRDTVKSQDEVVRWVRMARMDQWYRDEGCVSFIALDRCGMINQRRIKRVLRGEQGDRPGSSPGISDETCELMTKVIEVFERGELIFTPESMGGVRVKIAALWLDPPLTLPANQWRLVTASEWNYWLPCACCGGRKWLACDVGSMACAVCYHCTPPDEWPAFGGVRSRTIGRLVDRVVRAYFDRYGLKPSDLGLTDKANDELYLANLGLPQSEMRRPIRLRRAKPRVPVMRRRAGAVGTRRRAPAPEGARH